MSIIEHATYNRNTKQMHTEGKPDWWFMVSRSEGMVRFGSFWPAEARLWRASRRRTEREGQRVRFTGSAKSWQSKLMAKVSSVLDIIGMKCLVEWQPGGLGCTLGTSETQRVAHQCPFVRPPKETSSVRCVTYLWQFGFPAGLGHLSCSMIACSVFPLW